MHRDTKYIIAHAASQFGGAEVYTSNLVQQLSRRGHQINLICHEADTGLDNICRVHRIARPSFDSVPLAWRIGPLCELYFYRHVFHFPKSEKPSLIIASAQSLAWAYTSQFDDVPIVYVPHSLVAANEVYGYQWHSSFQRYVATRVIDYLESWFLQHSIRTVRFTKTGCEELRKRYGAKVKSRFMVFPPAVPIPVVSAFRKSNKTPRLLFVGRLVQSKNIDFLLFSLARLRKLPWHLDIVGDGPKRRELETLTQQCGLTERVRFHGHSNNVAQWYMCSDLLAFPSKLEYAPLVILEAMSFRVPTLCIRANNRDYFNANQEIIKDGEDGFLADDEDSFVVKLSNLIRNPKTVAEAGIKARMKIEDQYNWEQHINHYENLFSEILKL